MREVMTEELWVVTLLQGSIPSQLRPYDPIGIRHKLKHKKACTDDPPVPLLLALSVAAGGGRGQIIQNPNKIIIQRRHWRLCTALHLSLTLLPSASRSPRASFPSSTAIRFPRTHRTTSRSPTSCATPSRCASIILRLEPVSVVLDALLCPRFLPLFVLPLAFAVHATDQVLTPDAQVILAGHGTGKASATGQLIDELRRHSPDVLAKVAARRVPAPVSFLLPSFPP